jgi:sugar lactone lactonase YvrE
MRNNGISKPLFQYFLIFIISGCTNTVITNSPQKDKTFSTLSLTLDYLDRKISTFISKPDGKNLVKELVYGSNKYPNDVKDVIDKDPGLYSQIITFSEINTRRIADPVFDTFIKDLEPLPTGNVYTVAGNGQQTFSGEDGPATSAAINKPFGMAFDKAGNMYISDTFNSVIRKVNKQTGKISTIAGKLLDYSYSGDNGPATNATLSRQTGLVYDEARNFLYISDTFNARIRKLNLNTGYIYTVAGNGTQGYTEDNVQATSASINNVYGIDLDKDGNLYLSDRFNNRIRKVNTTTGIITTVAGNGTPGSGGDGTPATSANISGPAHTVFDKAGNLYISDAGNGRVRKVSVSNGNISTIAGGGATAADQGVATNLILNAVGGLIINNTENSLYIFEYTINKVKKLNLNNGTLKMFAGNGSGGYNGDNQPATTATFTNPLGGTLDKWGDVYIVDSTNSRIRKVIRDF